MAITIERQPTDLQPVNSDGLYYVLSSTRSASTLKYRYLYEVYVNGVLIFEGKSTPNTNDKGVVDIGEVLRNYTNSTVEIEDAISSTYIHQTERFSRYDENEVIEYFVKFGEEWAFSANTTVVQYDGITDTPGAPARQSSTRKTYNATYPNNTYSNYDEFDYSPYIMSGTPIQYESGLFLTNAPRIQEVSLNDRGTLSFFNYVLGANITSYPYKAEYTFYDVDGIEIGQSTIDNIQSNGGGPLTTLAGLGYDSGGQVSSGYTWNVLNVASGPFNIEQSIGIPSGTKYYHIRMLGKNQSSVVGCPSGYEPGYIESCGFGYQIPVCIDEREQAGDRIYWPSGASQWNPDCFFIASYGGPGGETFTGGTSYGASCGLCYDIEFGGLPETPPNVISSSGGTITGLTAVSETFQYNIVDDCDVFNNKQIIWRNRYGTYDYYRFTKRKSEGLSIERQTYKQIPVDWDSSSPSKTQISRGITTNRVSNEEIHVVNTGFVDRATMNWLEELFTSSDVYYIETDGRLFPIVITSTEYQRKNKGNRELINVELSYQLSNTIKIN